MHHRMVGRGRLDACDPRTHGLRRDVVDTRCLGGFHHEIATGSDRAEQREFGSFLGIGQEVVVEPDRIDLPGDDSRPALPAAPVGTAERGRSPRPQGGFEHGFPGLGLEPMSRGIEFNGGGHGRGRVMASRLVNDCQAATVEASKAWPSERRTACAALLEDAARGLAETIAAL